jgi:hypothetical protein
MTKLCPRGKSAAKRKFKVYPSAYANAYASKICAGKIKDPSGVKRKDFKGRKPASMGGPMDDKRDVRKVEQMIGKSRSSKREKGRKKAMGGGLMEATTRLRKQGLKGGGMSSRGLGRAFMKGGRV